MSRTELYIVKRNGELERYKEFGNSLRGAALLWSNLTRKYIGQSHKWISMKKKEMEELWRLDRNPYVPRELRILHISTFDHMLIKKENLQQFIDACKEVHKKRYFEDIGHFKYYPKVMEEILRLDNVMAIAWNQTSVSSGVWDIYETCPTCEHETIRRDYNIIKDANHQFLFEYLEEIS